MTPTEMNNSTAKKMISGDYWTRRAKSQHLLTVSVKKFTRWLVQASFPTHSLHEAGVQLVLGEDVQVEALDAEKYGGLDHGEGLLQPVAAGYHRQVHGRLWPAGEVISGHLRLTLLAHDVPGRQDRKMDGWMVVGKSQRESLEIQF